LETALLVWVGSARAGRIDHFCVGVEDFDVDRARSGFDCGDNRNQNRTLVARANSQNDTKT